MKYYTIDWWSGETADGQNHFDEYRKYLDRILDELPPDHQRLASELSLHDSRLLKLSADVAARTLILELDGYGFDPSSKAYFGRRFLLKYSHVEAIETTANPEKGLPGPHGYGDLGYNEIEVVTPGLYEHRMLFSLGIEMKVRHRTVEIQYTDAQLSH